MVFDWLNLFGNYVYGLIFEEKNILGIGMYFVFMVYGLMFGEFVCMIINEGWLIYFNDLNWQVFGIKVYQFFLEDLIVIVMGNYIYNLFYLLLVRFLLNLCSDLVIQFYFFLGLFEVISVNMG